MAKLISYSLNDDKVELSTSLTDFQVSPNHLTNKSSSLKRFWDITPYDLNSTCINIETTMSTFFNASHKMIFENGKEGEIHQHSYHLKITVVGEYRHDNLNTPFADMRKILNKISSIYEGKFLNDLPPFREMQSTTENFSSVLAVQLKNMSSELAGEISAVSLFESPTVGITIPLR